jgi:hypothetical protein
MKKSIIISIILLSLVNSSCIQKETPVANENEDEIIGNDNEDGIELDYLIYSRVLNYLCEHLNFSKILLSDSTSYYHVSDRYEYIQNHLDSIEVETIDNYISRNSEKVKIHEIDSLNFECVLYTPDFSSDWRNSYPDAYAVYYLSCVGYNEQQTQALIYYHEYYAPLSTVGGLVYLKNNGSWTVQKILLLYIG